ncbi:phage tail tape measure protein [Pelosinus sp. sgz500959]|uniref:phage tail tape measure protein n=1 Tax=Pelosinus sp. sgz500959 TaxID=3242472 RepID=UPI00366BFCF7
MSQNNMGTYSIACIADFSQFNSAVLNSVQMISNQTQAITNMLTAMNNNASKSMAQMAATVGISATQSVEQINRINQSMAMVNSTNATQSMRQLGNETGNLETRINQTTRSASNFSNILGTMGSHIKTIAMLGVITAPFMAINSMTSIERQMAGMIQTLPQLHNNQAAVNDVSKQFIGIAEQYGMQVDKIIEAGKLWSRGYKDVGEVMSLTGLTAKLAVADMMDVGLANRAVESVISGYGRQADAVSFATHVVDSFTNVSHNSQASATDLSEALIRTAAAAHVVGVSFDTTTALAATMIKATGQSGGNVGNALKSLFSSIHSDKAIRDLQDLGIQVYKFDKDGTASFRDVSSVMTDLMLTTHETSKNMEKDLQDIAGGKFQWSKVAALFSSYSDFIKTYNLSINSVGFSDGQVAAQMDTVSRKVQQVKASMDGLLVNAGNSGLMTGIKGMLDGVNSFIKGLQMIPASVYQIIGVTSMMALGWVAMTRTLGFLNAGVIGLRTALVTTTPIKLVDAVATGVETAALEADVIATNADTVAKSRLAVATSIATGGLNLILAGLTAAAIGGSVYATSLGSASIATENSIQKNEDLIAAKKQEIEMNKKQVDFIGTLGEAYIRLKNDLNNVGDDEKKAIKIKEDLGTTENELAKIIGEDGVKRIKTSDDVNSAISHEQEVHAQKTTEIQTSLNNLVTAQKELRDNTIQYCNDRIDAINNEAVDFAKAADAIGQSLGKINQLMFEYYRGKANFMGKMSEDIKAESDNGTLKQAWQMAGIPTDNMDANVQGSADSFAEQQNKYNAKADAIAQAAKNVAINQSREAMGLGGHWTPSGETPSLGGTDIIPVSPKGSGTGGQGETAYQIQKKAYEAALAQAKYNKEVAGEKFTHADELALYEEMMGNVSKIDDKHHQETFDYLKGEFELKKKIINEGIALTEAALNREIALAKISAADKQKIEDEIARKKANNIPLSADESKIDLDFQKMYALPNGSKEKVDAQTAVINAESALNDKQTESLQKALQTQYDIALDHSKKMQQLANLDLDHKKAMGLISDEDYLKLKIQIDQGYLEEQVGLAKGIMDKLGDLKSAHPENKQVSNAYDSSSKNYSKLQDEQTNQAAVDANKLKEYYNSISLSVNKAVASMSGAFTNMYSSIMKGGFTFSGLMKGIFNGLVDYTSNLLSTMTINALQQYARNLTAKKATKATEQVIDKTTAAAEVATNTAKNTALVASDQAAAASSMAAWTPLLLLMGALALLGGGGSSTSTSTSTVSLGRNAASYYTTPASISVPSFDVGTLDVPHDMLAQIHKGEVIVPAPFADGVRGMISGSSGNGNNSGRSQQRPFVLNHTFAPNLIDTRGAKEFYNDSSKEMVRTIRKEVRRFNATS